MKLKQAVTVIFYNINFVLSLQHVQVPIYLEKKKNINFLVSGCHPAWSTANFLSANKSACARAYKRLITSGFWTDSDQVCLGMSHSYHGCKKKSHILRW